MRTKVIIYGGAFNPPTIAHLRIAQHLVREAEKLGAELWIMPSGARLDKPDLVRDQKRLEYVKALIKSINTRNVIVRIETSEFVRRKLTQTIDTVRRYSRRYPDTRFIWVFGVDSVQTMMLWHEGEWLYRNLEMFIIERHGYSLTVKPPKATCISITMPVVSSTEVRERLSLGKSVRNLVPKEVHQVLTATI